MPITVFVCDDSAGERFLLGQQIKEQPGLYIAGAASTAVSAVRAIEATQPDVVILDHLDHHGDISVMVRAIREATTETKVVVYSGLPTDQVEGVESADAYVGKSPNPEGLWEAIRSVAAEK
jgi:DNA-binding NarL/FixJ family response regulator